MSAVVEGTGQAVQKVEQEISLLRDQSEELMRQRNEAIGKRKAAAAAGDKIAHNKAAAEIEAVDTELGFRRERLTHLTEVALPAARRMDAGVQLGILIESEKRFRTFAKEKFAAASDDCAAAQKALQEAVQASRRGDHCRARFTLLPVQQANGRRILQSRRRSTDSHG